MTFTDHIPGIMQDLNRQSQGSYKRGRLAGRREMREEILTELEKMDALKTEFEVREQLPELIKWIKEQE